MTDYRSNVCVCVCVCLCVIERGMSAFSEYFGIRQFNPKMCGYVRLPGLESHSHCYLRQAQFGEIHEKQLTEKYS